MPTADEEAISSTFNKVVAPKRLQNMDALYKDKPKKKKRKINSKDEDHYVPYQSADKHTEDGLAINNFERQAQNAEFSVSDRDLSQEVKHKPGLKKWDRIKKKWSLYKIREPTKFGPSPVRGFLPPLKQVVMLSGRRSLRSRTSCSAKMQVVMTKTPSR